MKLPSKLNLQNLIISFTYTPLLSSKISCMSGFISLVDKSDKEQEVCGVMTEKSELEVVHSWLQVGRSTSSGWGRGTGVVTWGILFCLIHAWFSSYSFFVLFYIPVSKSNLYDKFPFPLFQGLDLLKWASTLRERAQQLETEGLGKIEVAVAGSEAEGPYGFLRRAISHSPVSFIPSPLKNLATPYLLPSPNHPIRSLKKLYLKLLLWW